MTSPIGSLGYVREAVELRVLGRVEINAGDVVLPIAGALKQRLVSRLAVAGGQAVSVDSLIQAMWGEHPPRTARQSLHVHVNHVRARLRTIDAEHVITTTPDGAYRLGIANDDVDAVRFGSLCERGIAALHAGKLRNARDVLHDALGLWGEPYDSLQDSPAAIGERHRLGVLHHRALDAWIDALIGLGEVDRAALELEAALATDPLRERPYEQLMRIQLDRGERAEAIVTFEHAATVLASALGVDPSPPLQALKKIADDVHKSISAASLDLGLATIEALPLDRDTLLETAPNADTRQLVEQIIALASAQGRKVAHARIPASSVGALAPLTDLLGLQPTARNATSLRPGPHVFQQLSDGLVERFSTGLVLLVEDLENADISLIDYLHSTLSRPGPAPFTFLGVVSTEGLGHPLIFPLRGLCETQRIDLPAAPAVETLVDRLAPEARTLLEVMACAAGALPTETIVRATGLAVNKAAVALDRLIALGLVDDELGDRRNLVNAEAIAKVLGRASIATRHLGLAEAIELSETMAPEEKVVAEAAHRFAALPAGDSAKAWTGTVEAARVMNNQGLHRELIELVGDNPAAPNSWPEDQPALEVAALLGRAYLRVGLSTEGREVLLDAIDTARRLNHGQLFAEAVRALAEDRAPQATDDPLRSLLSEALDRLDDRPSDTRVQLMTDHANSWYFIDPAQAADLATKALSVGRRGEPATVARAITGFIQANMRPDNAAERLELALEAQQYARRSDSTESLILALTYEASALIELGQPRRADAPLKYAKALADDAQVPRFRWWAAAWIALVDFALGDLERAEDRFRAAYELWPTRTRTDPFDCFATQMAALRFVQDRGAELLDAFPDPSTGAVSSAYLPPAALAQAQAERHGDAEASIRLALTEGSPARAALVTTPFALALLAEAASLIELVDVGPTLVELTEPLVAVHATMNVWGGGGFYWGSLRHAHGLALGLAGQPAQARIALDAAARENAAAGVSIFADRSQSAARRLAHSD